MTPLDAWPDLAAAHVHPPRPAQPWRFASIREASEKLSPWNFFLYGLVAYARSVADWVESRGSLAADTITEVAAKETMTSKEFGKMKSLTGVLASTLKAERPIQDPYFMVRILHGKTRAILDTDSLQLLRRAHHQIGETLNEVLPAAGQLLQLAEGVVKTVAARKKGYAKQASNRNKGYMELLRNSASDLQRKMAKVRSLTDFKATYFPKTLEEDHLAQGTVPQELFLHLQRLLEEMWRSRSDASSIQTLLETAKAQYLDDDGGSP